MCEVGFEVFTTEQGVLVELQINMRFKEEKVGEIIRAKHYQQHNGAKSEVLIQPKRFL